MPLFVTNALEGEPLPVYGDGKQVREWLHAEDHCAGVDLVLREGAPGRDLQHRRRGPREPRGHPSDPRADRRRSVADPPRRGPRGTRPALRDRRHEAPRARLEAGALVRRGRSARDRRVVPREPRMVGADQVRRVPPLLRGAVRGAASGLALRRRQEFHAPPRRPHGRCSPRWSATSATAASPTPGTTTAFVVAGGGWGHGVGMSQWGAFGQAKAGRDYHQILATYYRGTEIGLGARAAARAGPRARRRRARRTADARQRRSRSSTAPGSAIRYPRAPSRSAPT